MDQLTRKTLTRICLVLFIVKPLLANSFGSSNNDLFGTVVPITNRSLQASTPAQGKSTVNGKWAILFRKNLDMEKFALKLKIHSKNVHQINTILMLSLSGHADSNLSTEVYSATSSDVVQSGLHSSDYLPCRDKSQLCIGMPTNCIKFENCTVLFKSSINRSTLRLNFELIGFDIKANENKYVAVGLSDDQKMGDDLVFVCMKRKRNNDEQEVEFQIRENRSKRMPRLSLKVRAEENVTKSIINGKITCKWELPYKVKIYDQQCNFLADEFFILMAKGKLLDFCKLRILDCDLPRS